MKNNVEMIAELDEILLLTAQMDDLEETYDDTCDSLTDQELLDLQAQMLGTGRALAARVSGIGEYLALWIMDLEQEGEDECD